jgi:membrane fusion protein (multidrug efflux system)
MKVQVFKSAGMRSVALVAVTLVVGGGVVAWKYAAAAEAGEATAAMAEPMEVVTAAVASSREHRSSSTAIGTVVATRSITLQNEIPGTVRLVRLTPGEVVETGTVLVELDVSVEEAELKALEARAALAASTLARLERMAEQRAVSAIELDNARAERDVALAEIERMRAVIERKRIRAPFRARVGIADVHLGQFLEAGSLLTTLQGVDEAVHVDFEVAQAVAANLEAGDPLAVFVGDDPKAIPAAVVAVDARVDPLTRNATVRGRIDDLDGRVAPGASVRVSVPVGPLHDVVIVPASALRKGPAGDHVFVLSGEEGATRAHVRPVQAGPALGDSVVILQGLQAGEQVAASGSFKLREGALVHIATNEAAATADAG